MVVPQVGIARPTSAVRVNGLGEGLIDLYVARIEYLELQQLMDRDQQVRDAFHVSTARAPPPESATAMQVMRYRLKTPAGRKLYALRKQMPEPVFWIINSVMGFRQFKLRGRENARGKWSLVRMSWNLKRMAAVQGV
jgi:hypothetical protein